MRYTLHIHCTNGKMSSIALKCQSVKNIQTELKVFRVYSMYYTVTVGFISLVVRFCVFYQDTFCLFIEFYTNLSLFIHYFPLRTH